MIAQPTFPTRSTRVNPWWLVAGIASALLLVGIYGLLRPVRLSPLERVKQQYLADITALDSAAARLQRAVVGKQSATAIQAAFRETRLAWKRVEFLAELYNPETSKGINGPALPEVEEDDGLQSEVQPTGLQVIEESLYPYDPANRAQLVQDVAVLRSTIGRLYKVSVDNPMTDSHVFDAMRLEVFRLITLGITGFDSPVANTSLPETAAALRSLQQHLRFYALADQNRPVADSLGRTFAASIDFLNQPISGPTLRFNDFDRLSFIRGYANVLSGLLLDAQKSLHIPVFRESRFLSASARTLNDTDAFDPSYFVDSDEHRATPDRIALGKMLFYDPILSGDPERTCATCHQPDKAFTDGEPKSMAVGFGGRRIQRNAPTLLNAAFQAVQFADSRVVYLEDQASDVIENTDEMHGSLPEAVKALTQNDTYRVAFAKSYRTGVTEQNLKNAIASYVRSLTHLDARVDRYLRGDQRAALTDEEKRGFNLFMGKAKCATCHFFPLFNGTVPPAYQKTESEVLGTPATPDNRRLDSDLGKFQSTKINIQKHSFKTPTVRFTAKTAPYMHNGVYRTLDEVINFYNEGGGNGLGFNLPNQTLPDDKLNLTEPEKRALVAFLKAL